MAVTRKSLPMCSGFYTSRSLPLDAQNCINWIPILPEAQDAALNDHALLTAQGVHQFANFHYAYPTRGGQQMANIAYYVAGNYLYRVNPDGSYDNLGYISGDGPVSMANNGSKLCIVVPRDKAYEFDSETQDLIPITTASSEGFEPANTVSFKDGYYVYTASSGDYFFISALNDPKTIDPLDRGAAEINPDKILAGFVNHNELYILGEDTIETFQNIGGDGFPFQRIQGAVIQKGLHAVFGLTYFDNTFLFIGGGQNEKSAIWKVVGSSVSQKVSTDAIDYEIQQFTFDEIANTIAYNYSDNGHFCAAFTIFSSRFEKSSVTFVFDATASALSGKLVWHQRQSGTNPNSWRINNVIECYGRLLCGDNVDGRIGELNSDYYDEYDDIIFRQKTSMPFANDGKAQFFGDIEALVESGVGDTDGDFADPQINLSYSNDGGRNFTAQSSRSLGKIGEYNTRCIWRRQGYFPRTRMLRIEASTKVRVNIINVQSWTEGGTQ